MAYLNIIFWKHKIWIPDFLLSWLGDGLGDIIAVSFLLHLKIYFHLRL